MGRLDRLPFFARPDGAARQMARIQRQVQFKWPLGGLVLESPLKIDGEASVFRGFHKGRPVVVKKFWDRGTRRRFVGHTVKALKRFQDLEPHPEFSVNEYIASSGNLGLLVVSFEAGQSLKSLLKGPAGDRSRLLQKCCAWQDWAAGGEVTREILPAGQFEAEISRSLAASAAHPDAALLGELGGALLRMLAEIADQPAARSPGHPDFAPRNLILRPDGGLTAVDIHRRGAFFRARQAAMFLVSKDFQNGRQAGPMLYGLNLKETRRFLAHGTVPEEETSRVLPFFIGLTYFTMYAKNPGRPRRMKVRRGRILAFLSDAAEGRRILP
ncbi:hypothetical protein [Cribrihabitans neustonicus]|uniref:hypothetical protein n=1 Tax=Cribrihabitans neustonicus TaxID=1429085 RepID=UPI003B5BFE50